MLMLVGTAKKICIKALPLASLQYFYCLRNSTSESCFFVVILSWSDLLSRALAYTYFCFFRKRQSVITAMLTSKMECARIFIQHFFHACSL
jgi:hypothetical protein